MQIQAINNNNNTNFRAKLVYQPEGVFQQVPKRWKNLTPMFEKATKDKPNAVLKIEEFLHNSLKILRSSSKDERPDFCIIMKQETSNKMNNLSDNAIVQKLKKIVDLSNDTARETLNKDEILSDGVIFHDLGGI